MVTVIYIHLCLFFPQRKCYWKRNWHDPSHVITEETGTHMLGDTNTPALSHISPRPLKQTNKPLR